jgi:ABC-type transport system involved in Fe-S cluster assembly fused permease/ATPase subunit
LGSPLYFKRLITLSTSVNEVDLGNKAIQSIATGFIIGYGMSKIASGFIQLISDNILYPATLEAAELLPSEAFNAALREASMRSDDYYENLKNKNKKESAAAVESGGEGQTGFARRALDRGLKASNQFLYRTIFNLFPSIVEAFCVVILIYNKTGPKVGLVSAIVGSIFVVVTAKVMHARIPIQRNMLKAEGVANGCADDALALAETVAAFGSEVLETERYSKALSGVSDASIRVRRSFSLLKLLQSTILGFGAAAVAFTAWHSNIGKTSDFTGQLILVQALFAQLCAPLDHIGQHFRDCVVAAEDLRDLENLKKKLDHLSLPQQSNSMPSSLRSDNSLNLTSSFYTTNPNVLEIKNLNFYYPGVSLLRGNLTQLREKAILKNISISIPSGGYAIGIVGPSGTPVPITIDNLGL